MEIMEKIAEGIKSRLEGRRPETLIILGSGLGSLAENISGPVTIPYTEIEGFPRSTVAGHAGRLVIGSLEGKDVICMQGRFHLYEGHPAQSINKVITAFRLAGIRNLVVTNAAGSLRTGLPPGSIMLIRDHINLSGQNPLTGPNDERLGPRFPDMGKAYTPAYAERMKTIARERNIPLAEGVYLMVSGPCFETAAEIRMFRGFGADAIGMSTVPEVISAVYNKLSVLGLSVITNFGAGLKTGGQSHGETLGEGRKASGKLSLLIKSFLREME